MVSRVGFDLVQVGVVASGRLAAAPRMLVSGARSSRSLPRARSRDACRPAAAVLLPRQCMLYVRQGHAGRLLTASSTWAGTAACGTQGRQGWQSKRLPKQQRRTHLSSERARRLPWPGAFALAGAGHLVEETVKFSSFVVWCLCDSCAGRRFECVCGKS